MPDILDELMEVLRSRKLNPTSGSYTSRLLKAGEDEIVKKIGEEAIELVLAAKAQGNDRLVEEAADLVYHLCVLLIARDLTWGDVTRELDQRRTGAGN